MGKVISVTGSLADTVGVKNPLRYRGYYYDVETKLYYLQSRFYDPETCRSINADSLLVAGDDYIQGVNMFAYCQNNPVMYSDPSGKAHEELVAALITVIGCMCYIGKFAEENNLDINAFLDYYNRKLKNSSLLDMKSDLSTGVYILSGEFVLPIILTSGTGTLADIVQLMGVSVPDSLGLILLGI